MNDLISRAWVLAEYDRQHQCPPGGVRKIMAEAPTIDAIPVDWLDDRANDITRAPLYRRYAQILIDEWQKEQEAR